jgi:hypothetical protein
MKRPFFIATILLITVIFVGIWVVSGNADITNETLAGNEQDEPASDKEELIADQDGVIQDEEEIIEDQENQVVIEEQEKAIKDEVIAEYKDELDQDVIADQEKSNMDTAAQDMEEVIDWNESSADQTLSEDLVARFDRKNNIDMGVVYSNLIEDNEEFMIFRITLNNHFINLETIKYDELAILSFGDGTIIDDGFIWDSTSQGHHVSGLLKLPKTYLNQDTDISDLGSVQLDFEGIGGPEKMTFKWERDVIDLGKGKSK